MEMADALKAAGFLESKTSRKKKKKQLQFETCDICGREIFIGSKCRCRGIRKLDSGAVKRIRK